VHAPSGLSEVRTIFIATKPQTGLELRFSSGDQDKLRCGMEKDVCSMQQKRDASHDNEYIGHTIHLRTWKYACTNSATCRILYRGPSRGALNMRLDDDPRIDQTSCDVKPCNQRGETILVSASEPNSFYAELSTLEPVVLLAF
jgi:hypothetical protein